MNRSQLQDVFFVPDCAMPIIEVILTENERKLIGAFGKTDFQTADVSDSLSLSEEQAEELLAEAYKRAVLQKKNAEIYRITDFYTRLGVFCQFENEKWLGFPEKIREQISEWYLCEFIRINEPLWTIGQREDMVVPLDSALSEIQKRDGPFYVSKCDCRSIFGRCSHSRDTCISFQNGINSPADRGHAREVSKGEVLKLVIDCDREGLMHTLEGDYGMCNCCGDCCFEYQTMQRRSLLGIFPKTHTIAKWNEKNCIHCGLCVRRCSMSAFSRKDKKLIFDQTKCVGCGICATACPKKTIEIVNRTN